MSASGYLNRIVRRADALKALEKAAGGQEEATWGMETLAAYYQRGGTLERLQAAMTADVAAAEEQAGQCSNCGDPNCTGAQQVPLREGFIRMGIELAANDVEWSRYPLDDCMPDDAEEAADNFDAQLPSHLVRISEVLVREYHENGKRTGRWFGAAAVTAADNLL